MKSNIGHLKGCAGAAGLLKLALALRDKVLPPMPIQVYKNFTDADLGAIFAYLRTIPAITNKVPEPLPPTEPSPPK